MKDFLHILNERVVVYDGAMGTNIQKRNPTLDDYLGERELQRSFGAHPSAKYFVV